MNMQNKLYKIQFSYHPMTDLQPVPEQWSRNPELVDSVNFAKLSKTKLPPYVTLPQTCKGKHHMLTTVEATTGWLESYPVPHATDQNTILGLAKQVLWRHGTPERTESDNGTRLWKNFTDIWAKRLGIQWVYHIPYHAPALRKIERYNGLLNPKHSSYWEEN